MSKNEEYDFQKNKMEENYKDKVLNTKSARPMGYIFPKRIQQAIAGEMPVVKTYAPMTADKVVDTYELDGVIYDLYQNREGKKYIKKDGVNIDVRVYDNMGTTVPLFCPECKRPMKGNLDEKFYWYAGKCHVCVADEEQKMRIDGTFKNYEKSKMVENQISFFKDAKVGIEEFLANIKPTQEYVNEDGTVEKWKTDGIEETKDFMNAELVQVNEKLEELYKEKESLDGELTEKVDV